MMTRNIRVTSLEQLWLDIVYEKYFDGTNFTAQEAINEISNTPLKSGRARQQVPNVYKMCYVLGKSKQFEKTGLKVKNKILWKVMKE